MSATHRSSMSCGVSLIMQPYLVQGLRASHTLSWATEEEPWILAHSAFQVYSMLHCCFRSEWWCLNVLRRLGVITLWLNNWKSLLRLVDSALRQSTLICKQYGHVVGTVRGGCCMTHAWGNWPHRMAVHEWIAQDPMSDSLHLQVGSQR